MKSNDNVRLTSAELGDLWTAYMQGSLLICAIKYFLESAKDSEVKPILKYALNTFQKNVQVITDIFNQENYPVPHGLTDDDVNLKAPRLFSDMFYPFFLEYMAKYGMLTFSASLPLIARSDIRNFISHSLDASKEISNRVVNVLLSKGLYVRPPYIAVPDKVDFIKKQSFLGNWFGEKRPLTAVEILNLFSNIRNNVIGHTLFLGLAQVAESKEVKKYLIKGKDITSKHIEIFSDILRNEDIPASTNWDIGITNSTTAPFSDKLMMILTTILAVTEITNYGASIAVSMRKDLTVSYVRLTAEVLQYVEDGMNIMINNGWMEQPPQAVNHMALVGSKS